MIVPAAPAAPAAVAAHYDALDGYYRELWGEHVHHGLWAGPRDRAPVERATRALAEHVIALARLPATGAEVVDVGCGYGATARLLAREHGARVRGLTLSARQAAFADAHRVAPDNPAIAVADWLENGLPSAGADAVLAIECLSHMPDKPRAFAELARVVRPGGRVVLTDWLARAGRSGWREEHLLRPICAEGELPSMHTAAEYATLIEEAGLRIEHGADLSRRVSRTWGIVARRAVARGLRDPAARAFLRDPANPSRVFARSVPRLMAAYGTRAMVYGVFAARRPA